MTRLRAKPEDYPEGSSVRRQLKAAQAETERLEREWEERLGELDAPSRPAADPAAKRPPAPKALQVNEGEELFALQLRTYGIPFRREYVFHQSRRWRFDFAIVEHLIAIEIEGAIWKQGGGGHSHPSGIESDIEKYNAAAVLGWRVFRFMPDKHVETGAAVALINDVLRAQS